MPKVQTPTAPLTLAGWLAGPPPRSQRWLADQVGVHQSMISMLARHKRSARGALAMKIHTLTGVPLEEMIVAEPPQPRRRRTAKALRRAPPASSRQDRPTVMTI